MAGYYSNLFQVPTGQLDARDVDLNSVFSETNRQGALEQSNKIYNGMTGAIGILNGVNGMLGASMPLSRTMQTPGFDYNLNNLSMSGTMDYSTNEQLMADYDRTNYGLRQNYDEVRGANDGQIAGGIASSALSGALSLGSVMPGYGHVLGALAGIAIGGSMAEAGKNDALNKTNADNLNVNLARLDGLQNRQAQANMIADRNYRFSQSHVVANGGRIERKQETIQQFANRVLGKKDSILPKRTLCKGGVMVKIRTK